MSKQTQADMVRGKLEELIDQGFEKTEIYEKLLLEFGLPRPTIRRIVNDYRKLLLMRISVLTPLATHLQPLDKIRQIEKPIVV